MFKGDIRVISEYYEPWEKHGMTRYYVDSWKQKLKKHNSMHVNPDATAFFDSEGVLRFRGIDDPVIRRFIENIESEVYREYQEYYDKSLPGFHSVVNWRSIILPYIRKKSENRIVLKYKSESFTSNVELFLEAFIDTEVFYHMAYDEFRVRSPLPGFDDKVLQIISDRKRPFPDPILSIEKHPIHDHISDIIDGLGIEIDDQTQSKIKERNFRDICLELSGNHPLEFPL